MSKKLELDYISARISKFEATILPRMSKFRDNLSRLLLGIFKIVPCARFIQLKAVRFILLSSTVYTNFSNEEIIHFHGRYIYTKMFF